jgi:hypothetical protein
VAAYTFNRLNNNDVTEKAAQVASCLQASDFAKALGIVHAALSDTSESSNSANVYTNLISIYPLPISSPNFSKWLKEVGQMLQTEDPKLDVKDPKMGKHVKCAVFYWLHRVVAVSKLGCSPVILSLIVSQGKPPSSIEEYAEEHSLLPRTVTRIEKSVETHCATLKTLIAKDVAQRPSSPIKASSLLATPKKTPRKPTVLRELPSRDTPKKRKLDAVEISASPSKRSDSPEDDLPILETPSKRPKLATPLKSVTINPIPIFTPSSKGKGRALPTGNKAASPLPATPSKSGTGTTPQGTESSRCVLPTKPSLPPLEEEEQEQTWVLAPAPPEQAPPVRRRYRPVYLDTAQWYSVDRRITKLSRSRPRQEPVC